jgi:hypothetical protein
MIQLGLVDEYLPLWVHLPPEVGTPVRVEAAEGTKETGGAIKH